ncbi:hypothetical protein EDC01DRAFT_630597 [Geopyxis carbonaria]|nr:hypothetical protein EDC01DRAFT_630597 [Geopyxis carbonaria]
MAQLDGIRGLFRDDGEVDDGMWQRTWLEDEREEIRSEARERRRIAAERIERESAKRLVAAGRFEPGDLVMLRDLNVAREKGMKFNYRWTGPFLVHTRTKGDTYVLRHLHEPERLLYGHHHRDDLKLWTSRPEHLRYAHQDWFEPELPTNMRQYRRGLVAKLKGMV